MERKKRIMIGLELPMEMKKSLEKESKEKEMILSGLIRLLIKEHLEKENDL